MRERDCTSKIAALTPPPWRQSIRGRGFESGIVVGMEGMIALVVSLFESRSQWRAINQRLQSENIELQCRIRAKNRESSQRLGGCQLSYRQTFISRSPKYVSAVEARKKQL